MTNASLAWRSSAPALLWPGIATRVGARIRSGRWWRAYVWVAPSAAAVVLALVLIRAATLLAVAADHPGSIGIDWVDNGAAGVRWLHGDSPFLGRQLNGPYQQLGMTIHDTGEYLYPPIALPFFAVFAYLPPILWWLIPAVLIAVAFARLRPSRWSWPILALCAGAGWSITSVIQGNPVIWFVALALWAPWTGWSGALVLLKPPLAPFALLGMNRRGWWVALALLAVASVPFGSLWADWFHAIMDMTSMSGGGVLYSFAQWPMMLITPVAWAARSRNRAVS